MNFVRPFGTNDKVEIPNYYAKRSQNLSSMLITSMLIPNCNKTMALKKSETVPTKESTDKQIITSTFTITLYGNILSLPLTRI